MIKGLYETHLSVKNLEASIHFYKNVLGLHQCYFEQARRASFFWIGKPTEYMLGLWEKPDGEFDKQHFAFRCNKEFILNESAGFLKSRNLKPYNFLKDGIERPMVFAWMPALAIYFDDPDGHSLEFISILDGEPRPELGVIAYDEWLKIKNGESTMKNEIHISEVHDKSKIPYDLLLIADPSRKNIDGYIPKSFVYSAHRDSEIVGCYVLCPDDSKEIEIMNIVVSEQHQNKGIGKILLNDAFEKAASKGFKKVKIGTGNSSIGPLYLYQKVGFRITGILPDFFIKNYDEPIFENGIQCTDMILLTKDL